MKRKFTKATALLLSLIFMFTAFSSLTVTVNAASEHIDIEVIDYPRGGGTDTWGHPALHYMNGWNVSAARLCSAIASSNNGMQVCYCVQPGVSLHPGDQSPEILPENFLDTYNNNALVRDDIVTLLGRIIQYGYTGTVSISLSDAVMAEMIATQMLVHEVIVGERANDFSHITPSAGYNACAERIRSDHPLRADIFANYNRIVTSVQNHSKIPSFMNKSSFLAPVNELAWNGTNYSVTLTDNNGVLANFNFSSPTPGVNCTKSGNNLTISTVNPPSGDIEIQATKTGSVRKAITFWCSNKIEVKGTVQGLIMSGQEVSDPVSAFVKVKVSYGSLAIIKTTKNNGGAVAGFTFEVRNSSNALIGTYTTTSSGKIDIPNLQPGWYSVKEINLSDDFVQPTPNPVSVEVKPGQTASVSFDNIRKRGIITIQKINANPAMGDYSLKGAVFEIRDAGNTLVDTVTVPESGIGTSKILDLGVYRVTEKSSPPTGGFVRNTNTYTVTLTGSQGLAEIVYSPICVIPETPQVARINIEKYNSDPAMGDYDLKGTTFEIFYPNGSLADTVIVDEAGKGQSKELPLGKGYTVTEKTASHWFVRNKNTFTVDLNYGGEDKTVIYENVRIPEYPQTGQIKVYKYNSNPSMGDYDLKGATFEIRNTVTGGLMDTVIVDENGYGISKQLPLTQPGKFEYSLRETKSPWGFFINGGTFYPVLSYGGQEVEIVFTDVTVPQRPQTGIITVEKRDVYNNTTPSGDATLKGMVVEIYDSTKTKVLDTLYCGNDVKMSSIELKLGPYFYREKNPPVGYTHDPNFYPFSIDYAGQEIPIVYISKTLTNKPIEGQISLVKHTDLPNENVDPLDPQIEKPVKATFEIYLKRVGSYADSKERERDRITTDPETGYAISKKLPYGLYVVEEVSAEGDVKLVAPFTVFINSEGKVYPFILNDPTFTSLVKVVKVDAETGKQIPAAGIGVKIWDVANNRWVEQTLNYPTIQKLDTFYTAGDGTVVLVSPLPSGNYLLYEQPGTSPHGYLLTKDPVPFTIHSTQHDPTIIEVLLANKPAKGTITIEKTGELLTGVQTIDTEFGKMYIPIFSQTATSGQKFVIKAARDIVTGDGTVRAKAGEICDTLTIANGTATSKLLYLGDYIVEESFAGEPFVKNPKQYPVSLVFENENTPVVTSTIKVENKRQAVELELIKLMEKPVDAPDGFNAFADVTFGIFAAEDVKDNSGKVVIPKNGLISLMHPDNDGRAVLNALLPFCKIYAKELKTNIFYDLNSTLYPVELKWQGEDVQVAKFSVTGSGIAIPNELKHGRIVVEKTGEMLTGANRIVGKSDVQYTPIYEVRGLPDVVFLLYADEDIYNVFGKLIYKKNDLVDTLKTGQDGKAESKLIHLGRYKLVEDVPFGYVAENNEYPVTLGFDGEVSEIITKTVSIHNERQKAKVTLDKIMELPDDPPDNFNPYEDVLFGLYARENIKNADGEVAIPAGAMLEIFGVDAETGEAVIKTDLPVGNSFFIQEIMTGIGYKIIDTEFDVVFDYAPEKGATVEIAVNGGKPIENKLQRGSLRIIKEFEGRIIPIPNVLFTIIGETTVGTTVTIEAKTDENGIILLEGLLVGNYRIIELESDLTIGYVLSPEENAVVVADQIAELTINNKLQRGDLRIIKEFENQIHPIAGVKFTVTGKTLTGDDYYGEFETDENGCVFIEGLVCGDYKVLEIGSDLTTGYVLSEEQATMIAHEQITEMTIHNRLIRGNVRLLKLDSSTGKPLQGAEFTLYDPDGNMFGVYTTDENGVIFVEGLPYGIGYKWVETKAPAGFKITTGEIPFDISEDGVTIELNAENDRVPPPDNPKTGDESNPALWLILMGASAAALVTLGIAGKRRKSKRIGG